MIRNGLYHIAVEMLDGVQGGNQGVMVVRDGTLRGGDSCFYAYGSYTLGNGKWKGEPTVLRSPARKAFDSNRNCGC